MVFLSVLFLDVVDCYQQVEDGEGDENEDEGVDVIEAGGEDEIGVGEDGGGGEDEDEEVVGIEVVEVEIVKAVDCWVEEDFG